MLEVRNGFEFRSSVDFRSGEELGRGLDFRHSGVQAWDLDGTLSIALSNLPPTEPCPRH